MSYEYKTRYTDSMYSADADALATKMGKEGWRCISRTYKDTIFKWRLVFERENGAKRLNSFCRGNLNKG